MPRARVEIAERLVLDLVHLGEDLDPHQILVAVVGRDVVADDVAARTPHQVNLVAREEIAGLVDLRPVEHLERDVVQLWLLVDDEVQRVVVGVAAHEHEEVAAPV